MMNDKEIKEHLEVILWGLVAGILDKEVPVIGRTDGN